MHVVESLGVRSIEPMCFAPYLVIIIYSKRPPCLSLHCEHTELHDPPPARCVPDGIRYRIPSRKALFPLTSLNDKTSQLPNRLLHILVSYPKPEESKPTE